MPSWPKFYLSLITCRENVGWASTCNAVGQTAGYFLGNVVFLALESPEFCNNYLRSTPQPTGLVTIQGKYIVFTLALYSAVTVSTLRQYLYLRFTLHPTTFSRFTCCDSSEIFFCRIYVLLGVGVYCHHYINRHI